MIRGPSRVVFVFEDLHEVCPDSRLDLPVEPDAALFARLSRVGLAELANPEGKGMPERVGTLGDVNGTETAVVFGVGWLGLVGGIRYVEALPFIG